jgi:hypothetical protein
MGSKAEDVLVRELAERLRPRFANVWTHRKPSASPRFKAAIEARLGYVPILQPEIDLCMRTHDGQLLAVEAKLFSGSGLTYRSPFYEGIGQALALHRYGFDFCSLWFLFAGGAQMEAFNRYGAEAWAFVRNDLRLPLDFTYLAVSDGPPHRFDVLQYTGRQQGVSLLPIDDPSFVLTWKHPNPIRRSPVQQALRETLDEWL